MVAATACEQDAGRWPVKEMGLTTIGVGIGIAIDHIYLQGLLAHTSQGRDPLCKKIGIMLYETTCGLNDS